jgi:hypothetical protein
MSLLVLTTAASAQSLDLPIPPIRFGDQIPDYGPKPSDDTSDDDPRDTPPPTIYGEEIDTETDTIVYVLDVSCSMGWDSQSYTTLDGSVSKGPRIDRAKAELARSISGLSDNFKFNIIAYDCTIRQWKRSMVEASDGNKQSAIAWTAALNPAGATATGPGTALALDDKDNKSIVLLTDGVPNCGANGPAGHRSMIANANSQGASISVFGIAASGSYRAFCQAVAGDSGGSYFDIP